MNDVLKEITVVKRSGQRVSFNGPKVAIAIKRAFDSVYDTYDEKKVNKIYENVLKCIENNYQNRKTINVEDVQDIIENELKNSQFVEVYTSFREYRLRRAASREVFTIKQQHKFVKAIEKVGYTVEQLNNKKPNEIVDKFAKTISKEFASSYLIENKIVRGLEDGTIYVNDLKSYSIGNTSSSHLISKNIKGDNLDDYFTEVINTVILCKNDQYKEHTLVSFDIVLVEKIIREFKNIFYTNFIDYTSINGIDDYLDKKQIKLDVENIDKIDDNSFLNYLLKNEIVKKIFDLSYKKTLNQIKEKLKINFKRLFQTLDTTISSEYKKLLICFDNNDSFENNLIVECYFESIVKTNKIETNIFFNENEKINQIISKAILNGHKVNLIYEKNKEINYFSNGEKIYHNINDNINTSKGRTINSTVTVNLARLALKNKNKKDFFEELDSVMDLSKNALIQRYDIQANKTTENYNRLFDKGLLFDSEKLETGQKIRKVIRNGGLVIGFSGLVETINILRDKQDTKFEIDDFELTKEIINKMNKKCDELTKELKLNFILCETYDKPIVNELIKIDKSLFGIKKQINKNYYEPFYKYILNSKIAVEEKYNILGKYQKLVSSIVRIKLNNSSNESKILKLINELRDTNICYVQIGLENDN